MSARITPEQKRLYFERLDAGYSRAEAARRAKISYRSAQNFDRLVANSEAGRVTRDRKLQDKFNGPIPYDDLCDEAKRAWNDFAYFQLRYLGRIPIHWQVEAAEVVVEALESDDESWLDINAPPGSGKSTTFTHDIPAWLTVRDRAITGLLGSAVQNTSEKYLYRLKNTLERPLPVKADPRLVRRGLAVDAVATLSGDFGRFKPVEQGIWAADQIVVMQHGGVMVAEKEPTWSAFGRKGGVLGMRYRFVVWDDLADPKRLNSEDLIEEDQEWYIDVAESRLEPGGTFIMQGQRLGPNDLHHFALGMREQTDEEEDEDLDRPSEGGERRKYRHIKYKAHYDELCQGNHSLDAPAYGEEGGCLLYPRRLSWRRLSGIMLNRLNRFLVLYQQEDVDPESVLVQRSWVAGDSSHPGCWDTDRDRLEIPQLVRERLADCLSVATADPSPSKYWCVSWWLYDPQTDFHYLMDLERRSMSASDFLDYNAQSGIYTGIMPTWQQTSHRLGIPIEHWIVETNAAQKFLLQYNHVKTWVAKNNVQIHGHETHRNKSDSAYGVQTIGSHWEYGRVRLPGKYGSMGRVCSEKLIDEVTKYPNGTTTDCVMAQWFYFWWLPYLHKRKKRRESAPPQHPGWIAEDTKMAMALAGVGAR